MNGILRIIHFVLTIVNIDYCQKPSVSKGIGGFFLTPKNTAKIQYLHKYLLLMANMILKECKQIINGETYEFYRPTHRS